MRLTENKLKFFALAEKKFGHCGTFKNKEMLQWVKTIEKDFKPSEWDWVFNKTNNIQHGVYRLPKTLEDLANKKKTVKADAQAQTMNMSAQIIPLPQKNAGPAFDMNAVSKHNHTEIPAKDRFYVPFGDFKILTTLFETRHFFPVFISGLSGNGKTFMVEQACAKTRRSLVRVQMSRETDEDDLIGGLRLINGETKFMKGPVIMAMETGSVLLIDEADRADPGKTMCLQGILEGKPYYVKKTGEVVHPASGFTVIVTANTKGKGSMDGRYVAAAILDDAWLERFPITIEQEYPNNAIEKRILTGYLCDERNCDEQDHSFIDHLIAWASITRKTHEEGAIDEFISTRRLVHIIKTFLIFGNRTQAIQLCISRFDTETKNAFLELYTKVDPTVAPPTPVANTAPAVTSDVSTVS